MKKNDDTIQKLFDDYAEGLNERTDLVDKARQALAEQNVNRAPQKRKSRIWRWLAPICTVLILVVSISLWAQIIRGLGSIGPGGVPNYPNDGPSSYPSQSEGNHNAQVTYYSLSDVKGRSVTPSQASKTIDVSAIESDGDYKIVYERYYAFYFASGRLAYVKALLGVRSEEGFCEIVIIAEVDGVVRKDLRDFYDGYIRRNDVLMHTDLDEKGEYVTNACFSIDKAHCYVSAMTGANGQLAEKIISKIL